ncbi:MAG: hypothetical protein ACKPKO_53105, partial [Candidatus Fonsibacter sp.]
MGMSAKRSAAIAEVDRKYLAGELSCDTVNSLVRRFPVRGVLGQYAHGQKYEGEPPGGQSWSDREEPSSADEVDVDALCSASAEKADHADTVEQGEVAGNIRLIRSRILVAQDV